MMSLSLWDVGVRVWSFIREGGNLQLMGMDCLNCNKFNTKGRWQDLDGSAVTSIDFKFRSELTIKWPAMISTHWK